MHDITDRGTHAREDRSFTLESVELRTEDDGTLTFDGVASMVDKPYVVRDGLGEFEETFHKGSFTKTIQERDDVALLVNHTGIPLARTTSRTLELSATPNLRAVAPLDPQSPLVQTVSSAMKRGDMDQMSVGFRAVRQKWSKDYTERAIFEAQLFDVSLVTRGMNNEPGVAQLRSLDDLMSALTADDFDEDEIRRLIAHAETLLPTEEREEIPMHPDLVASLYASKQRDAAWRAEGLLIP